MKNSIKAALISVVSLGAGLLGGYFLSPNVGYKTLEDCLLGEISKAKSSQSARMVYKACDAKYPEANPFDKFDEH